MKTNKTKRQRHYISNENKRKTIIKGFRISAEDNSKLEKILEKEGKTLSEFVRDIIKQHF